MFHIDTKLLKRKLNAPDNRQQEHIDNNTAVRDMLVGRGIYPEQLPPAEDVKKVERRLSNEEKSQIKKNK